MSRPADQADGEFHDALEKITNEEVVDELINRSETMEATGPTDDRQDAASNPSLTKEQLQATETNRIFTDEEATDLDEHNTKQTSENSEFDDFIDEEGQKSFESVLSAEEIAANSTEAKTLKQEGNDCFRDKEFHKAIASYTKALRICPTSEPENRAILYSNRAAAKISLDSKKAAIDDCSVAIDLNPNYIRALLRRGQLYEETEKLDESLEDFKKVLDLDPGNRTALDATVRLPPLINERNEKLKEEMIDKLKDLGNMILRPFGLSTSNFQMQQDPNTGSYSINFNKDP